LILAAAVVVVVFLFGRSICSTIIDYYWWRELGQVPTWLRMSLYRYAPGFGAWVIAFAILWLSQARGMRKAGEHLRDHMLYSWAITVVAGVIAVIISLAAVDGWTVARYFGGHGSSPSSEWRDPAFGEPLGFYFFDLPFYSMLINFLAACTLGGALAYYAAARGWQIRRQFPGIGSRVEIDLTDFRALGRLESGVLNGLLTLFLVMLAAEFWLGRYDLLLSDHGQLMVGIDYVQQNLGLPLQAAKAGAALIAAALVIAGKRKWAIACAAVLIVDWVVPPLVSSIYVRPNELALERPFIERHIEATRSAYGIDRHATEKEFAAVKDGRIDFEKNRELLDNVRLWDWRAFHETLGQIQPLRPYTFADTDVDRYVINGNLRQVLLAPRELDPQLMPESWINRSLIFTHGYGLALAEANRISSDGLPELLVKDAPIQVLTPSLKITRPQIYYGETSHEPVFAPTTQEEFDYPSVSGSGEVHVRYQGGGGFSLSAPGLRAVAAISEGDWNIVLSNAITADSRMMIRRRVPERLQTLAEFITWDSDPYLVISDAGRLIWIEDGYTTSAAHPYSRDLSFENGDRFNYIRNAVKATVDAYSGEVHMYVFDLDDPLILAYRRLFPGLFEDASAMPADLRAHTRAPETLFRTQAEIFRTYHMRQPESYYNRADLWDLATYTAGQNSQPQTVTATYMVATLPGEARPEFLLMIPFTPRGKQNLIGLMVARCDGAHLGEVVFLDLPKQEIIDGPIQIDALINQDQNISKDLSLWSQQGSQVLRSQALTLPIDNTFLYVELIYIQANQARMPQLKKVALVVGNTLIYRDTYEQALADLQGIQRGLAPVKAAVSSVSSTAAPAAALPAAGGDPRIEQIREHLKRYQDLAAQGKWSDAGKELDAIEAIVKK
jgi:uncharacterized protein